MAGRHPHPRECGVVDDSDLVVAVENLGDHLFGDLLAGQCLRQLGTGARPHGELLEADLARHLGLAARRLRWPGGVVLAGTASAARPEATASTSPETTAAACCRTAVAAGRRTAVAAPSRTTAASRRAAATAEGAAAGCAEGAGRGTTRRAPAAPARNVAGIRVRVVDRRLTIGRIVLLRSRRDGIPAPPGSCSTSTGHAVSPALAQTWIPARRPAKAPPPTSARKLALTSDSPAAKTSSPSIWRPRAPRFQSARSRNRHHARKPTGAGADQPAGTSIGHHRSPPLRTRDTRRANKPIRTRTDQRTQADIGHHGSPPIRARNGHHRQPARSGEGPSDPLCGLHLGGSAGVSSMGCTLAPKTSGTARFDSLDRQAPARNAASPDRQTPARRAVPSGR
jgi:hypothetical protein